MTSKRRAYGELRDLVEKLGGTMEYERKDHRYGAWVITLNGKGLTDESEGARSFPKIDKLHKPKRGISHPTQWDDYLPELVDGAEEKLKALLK